MSDNVETDLEMNEKFVTVINCMDGRVQTPVNEWMKRHYHVSYVDTITEPGPNKILAEQPHSATTSNIRHRLEISVFKHGSKVVAITGHADCAGNPTDDETQMKQIENALQTITNWGLNIKVIGLWVDNNWNVHQIL
jgi:carbonic anhydrase